MPGRINDKVPYSKWEKLRIKAGLSRSRACKIAGYAHGANWKAWAAAGEAPLSRYRALQQHIAPPPIRPHIDNRVLLARIAELEALVDRKDADIEELHTALDDTYAKLEALTKPRTPTVAGTIKRLIAEGKTNEEVWKIVQPKFNLSDEKRNYPAWYRADMKRKSA